MPENDSRGKTAIVMILLSLSTICLYVSMEAAIVPSRTVSPISIRSGAPEKGRAGSEHAVALVTASLEKHDFARARAAAEDLAGLAIHDQIMGVIDSADTRWTLAQVASAVRATHYREARTRAGTLRDEGARRELLDVIDFAEARTAIAAGDMERASELGVALRPALKRAILFTALAAREADDHDTALRCAALARAELPRIDQRYRRRVLAMVASVMLKVDREYGLSTLDRALHAGGPGGPRGWAGSGHPAREAAFVLAGNQFVETVSARGASQAFSLVIPGIHADLTQLLIEQHGEIRCIDPKHGNPVLSTVDGHPLLRGPDNPANN